MSSTGSQEKGFVLCLWRTSPEKTHVASKKYQHPFRFYEGLRLLSGQSHNPEDTDSILGCGRESGIRFFSLPYLLCHFACCDDSYRRKQLKEKQQHLYRLELLEMKRASKRGGELTFVKQHLPHTTFHTYTLLKRKITNITDRSVLCVPKIDLCCASKGNQLLKHI